MVFRGAVIITLLFLLSPMLFSQTIFIHDPGDYDERTFRDSELCSLHQKAEQGRQSRRIVSISSTGEITEGAERWQNGTWFRGYQSFKKPSIWFGQVVAGGYWSCHPLVRHSGYYGRGYMHAHRCTGDSLYKTRFDNAMDYLVSGDAQQPSGGFIYWYKRPGKTTPDTDDLNGNRENIYDSSIAVRALVEGYWYKIQLNESNLEKYLQSVKKGSDWLVSQDYRSVAANFVGFAAWALAGAYKVTGEERYLNKAIELCEWLISHQSTDEDWSGVWRTGRGDAVPGTVLFVEHDTQIAYHFIILRGLVETLSATPDERKPFKNNMRNSIKRAVNHVIDYRVHPSDHTLATFWRDTNGNLVPFENRNHATYPTAIEAVAMLYYYAHADPGFFTTEVARLRSLLNRLIRPFSVTARLDLLPIAYYRDYISNLGILDYRVENK